MFKAPIIALFVMVFSLTLQGKDRTAQKPEADELEAAESFLQKNSIRDASILLEVDDSHTTLNDSKSFGVLPTKTKARSLAGAGFTY